MATLTMPQLGESVTEGSIIRWLKQPGDHVALDEPLVEVETEKVNVEIPSPFEGTLTATLVAEGETVDVGTPLAEIATADEPAAAAPSERPAPTSVETAPIEEEPVAATVEATPQAPPATTPGVYRKRRFSPAVERLAAERGIDPSTVQGTGVGGRVTRKDVLAAVPSPPPVAPAAAAPPPQAAAPTVAMGPGDSLVTFSSIRRRIAQAMTRSKYTAPHAWLLMETDVTELTRLRERLKTAFREREGVDLTYLAFAAKAVCQALHQYPILNATWSGEDLVQRLRINLGIAVDTPDGLIVPVIHDADRMSVAALAISIADLAGRARSKRLTLDDVQGGTFTIDNTGVFGGTASAPIINYPQVAILTTEAIIKRPVVLDNDAIAVRAMMNLCLSFDHRVMDGSVAAAFAALVRDRLQRLGPDSAIY